MNLPGLSAAREAHRCEKFGIVHEMCGKSSFGTPAHHGRGTAARERRSSCRRAISEADGPCKREEIRRKLFNLSGHLFEGSITISITISFYRFLYEFTLPTCDLQGLLADFDPHGGKARDNSNLIIVAFFNFWSNTFFYVPCVYFVTLVYTCMIHMIEVNVVPRPPRTEMVKQ